MFTIFKDPNEISGSQTNPDSVHAAPAPSGATQKLRSHATTMRASDAGKLSNTSGMRSLFQSCEAQITLGTRLKAAWIVPGAMIRQHTDRAGRYCKHRRVPSALTVPANASTGLRASALALAPPRRGHAFPSARRARAMMTTRANGEAHT